MNSNEVRDTVADLRAHGHVYEGRLPPPKGEVPEDWEDREQTLFRATEFGDDIDRPLLKSDGSYTYFASDVAYSRNKIRRGFNELIYVLGADHGGYVKRLEAVAAAIAGPGKVDVIVRLCQLVKLFRNGEPVRMSKRAGEFVTLREVVDEVGADVRPLHDALPQERGAPRFRFRQGHRAVEGQCRFSMCSTPMPASARCCATGRRLARPELTTIFHYWSTKPSGMW